MAYAIGVARPVSIAAHTFGTEKVDPALIVKLIKENFDLRPGAIIRDLNLRHIAYRPLAAYGHFGRTDLDLSWEKINKVAALRSGAGLPPIKVNNDNGENHLLSRKAKKEKLAVTSQN